MKSVLPLGLHDRRVICPEIRYPQTNTIAVHTELAARKLEIPNDNAAGGSIELPQQSKQITQRKRFLICILRNKIYSTEASKAHNLCTGLIAVKIHHPCSQSFAALANNSIHHSRREREAVHKIQVLDDFFCLPV